MDVIQERCDRIASVINKRENERRLDIERKREDKRLVEAETENVAYLEKTFAEKQLEIETAINAAASVPPDQLPQHFDAISKDILELQKFVASSKLFLRTYDIKKTNEGLLELTSRARDLEESLLPKKRFGFKRRPKPVAKASVSNGSHADEVDCAKKPAGLSTANLCGFEGRTGETLSLERDAIFKQDVTLRNLTKCTVALRGSPSTLHIKRLTDCVVLTGPVSTSIFMDDCAGCKFVVACQQLRLHTSTDIDVYLHVTSRAIMEDCTDVRVAPYSFKYDKLVEDFVSANLDINTNNWTGIDDFNWLNVKQSPNWKVIQESDRVVDWSDFCLTPG